MAKFPLPGGGLHPLKAQPVKASSVLLVGVLGHHLPAGSPTELRELAALVLNCLVAIIEADPEVEGNPLRTAVGPADRNGKTVPHNDSFEVHVESSLKSTTAESKRRGLS